MFEKNKVKITTAVELAAINAMLMMKTEYLPMLYNIKRKIGNASSANDLSESKG